MRRPRKYLPSDETRFYLFVSYPLCILFWQSVNLTNRLSDLTRLISFLLDRKNNIAKREDERNREGIYYDAQVYRIIIAGKKRRDRGAVTDQTRSQ